MFDWLYVAACSFQRGSQFIDGVALEEYADEQDDYAQEREIEACIKAVDVDCDGKIGGDTSRDALHVYFFLFLAWLI